MKKVLAIILSLLMAASLFACGSGGTSSPSPSAAASPSATPSAAPSSAAPSPSEAASPSADVPDGLSIPNVDFKVTKDPFSREKYKICDITIFITPFGATMNECYTKLGEKLNYEFSYFDANGDTERFMQIIEQQASIGDFDGMILEGDYTTEQRIFELADEYKFNYIPGLSPFVDENNNYLRPSAVMDSFDLGGDALKFMVDNKDKYFSSPIDMKDIGFVTVTFSVVTDLNARVQGALDAYTKLYPELVATNYFAADTVSAGVNAVTAQAAYDQVAAIVSAHADLKGWFIFGSIEDFAAGSARAMEDMNKKGSAIATSCAAITLMNEWDTGAEGVWVAGIDTPPIQWADATISGLLQLIDGTATPETLWENLRDPSQKVTVIKLPYTVVTHENYKDYQAAIASYLDAQYPG